MTLYDKLREARAEYDKAKRKVNRLNELLDDALYELGELKIVTRSLRNC